MQTIQHPAVPKLKHTEHGIEETVNELELYIKIMKVEKMA